MGVQPNSGIDDSFAHWPTSVGCPEVIMRSRTRDSRTKYVQVQIDSSRQRGGNRVFKWTLCFDIFTGDIEPPSIVGSYEMFSDAQSRQRSPAQRNDGKERDD